MKEMAMSGLMNSEVYSSPKEFTNDCRSQFKCRAALALLYLVLFILLVKTREFLLESAAVFSGNFRIWVTVNGWWFGIVFLTYLYYGFSYKFNPGDSWPRIQLDIVVLCIILASGVLGVYIIESDKYLHKACGKEIVMTPEQQTEYDRKVKFFVDSNGYENKPEDWEW